MDDNGVAGSAEPADSLELAATTGLARYLPELDEIEISEEQKLELLGILYSIMRSFVELGFDVASADIWGSISNERLPFPLSEEDSGTNTSEEKSDEFGAQ